ncbi:MAG: formate dehydrogenase accessory sulfurtransferase FdhD [Caldilineaceae bacterium]|nr:formate dehydrogenase accessory sulfurtransferase FdhD [Caldilineaceae bacterium]
MSRQSRDKRRIAVFADGKRQAKSDYLAGEEPLEIQLRAGGETQTVAITMRTPGNDYELAAGFLFNEGIVAAKHDVGQMIYCVDGRLDLQEYNLLRVDLNFPRLPDLHHLDRHFFTTSACGVCGRTMLEHLETRRLEPLTSGPAVSVGLLLSLPAKLRQAQQLFASTGGLHAAALFDREGTLLQVREDVGRHNALDKLIGWGMLNGQLPFAGGIVLVSGRASYELLQKCRVAAAPILCAVSAPSTLAVDLAEHFGITLVGFLRESSFNVYSGSERIAWIDD